MNENITLLSFIFAVASSVIASLIVFYYLGFRERKIKKKIEDIHSEEKYIERISKGNIQLLRSTFLMILLAMFICFISAAIILAANALNFDGKLRFYSYSLSSWLMLLAAGVTFLQLRSISYLKDLKRTKKNFQKKRDKLEGKLK